MAFCQGRASVVRRQNAGFAAFPAARRRSATTGRPGDILGVRPGCPWACQCPPAIVLGRRERWRAVLLRGRGILPGGELAEAEVELWGASIAYAGTPRAGSGRAREHDGWIVPGFIDLHLHGAGGGDTMDATPRALGAMAGWAARGGTTGFLATTMSASAREITRATDNAASYRGRDGARLLGIHLEGPYINPEYAGAHAPDAVTTDLAGARRLVAGIGPLLRRVTLAPELVGATALVRWLRCRGVVVSLGHTASTYAQLATAWEAGASMVTHTFNAMRAFHHREPGAVGGALEIPGLDCEVILDGHHVHAAAFRLLWRARPGQVFFATDAMRAAGMPEGKYRFGAGEVTVAGGRVTRPNGGLSGSVVSMAASVRNAVQGGLPLVEAVHAASERPARAAGLVGRGSLAAGQVADVVLLRPDLTVAATIVEGELVFQG
ncbi:MAG TPA: N-acetylglucosamine-6-phosphate deacetylase [Clostridiales bacterium UBA8153]|nr:N-acetylglucosamine-6-phosphate deacetylase [Clostridiales bacterium UBA8153]